MTNRETSSNVTGTDNDSERAVDSDNSSCVEVEGSTQLITASCENLVPDDVHNDDADDHPGDGDSVIDPSAHSREVKKRKIVKNQRKQMSLLCSSSQSS